MIRALWDSTFTPYAGALDFKEPPFDLGSFDEILHRGSQNRRFMAGFDLDYSADDKTTTYGIEVEFAPGWGQPVLSHRRYSNGGCWIEQRIEETGDTIQYGTPNGSWSNTMMKVESEEGPPSERVLATVPPISLHHMFMRQMYQREEELSLSLFAPLEDSPQISKSDLEYIDRSLGDILDLEQNCAFIVLVLLRALLYDLNPNALMIRIKSRPMRREIIFQCIYDNYLNSNPKYGRFLKGV